MKRVLFGLIILLTFMGNVLASSKEPIKVYLFWSNSCHNCHNLMKYFSNVYQNYDYFEIVTLRTDNNYDNALLSNKVAELVGEEAGYVPLVVIGDSYHVLGFNETLPATIIKEARKAYKSDTYQDIVANLIESEDIKYDAKSFSGALEDAGIKNYTKIVVPIIFLVSSGILLGTSMLLKKNKLLKN